MPPLSRRDSPTTSAMTRPSFPHAIITVQSRGESVVTTSVVPRNPGDWVAFFSAQRVGRNPACTHYKFVAALCVEKKIAHPEIFTNSENYLYRACLNLLIRPQDPGWEHYEPGLAAWHDDWLWRVCLPNGQHKNEVVAAGRVHAAGFPLTIQGRPLPMADNYVIFSPSSVIVARKPALIAVHYPGEASEIWQTDARSSRIRELLFGSSKRGLRTGNRQQPHRHFRRQLEHSSWPMLLRDVL
jgi:hypothetical protein